MRKPLPGTPPEGVTEEAVEGLFPRRVVGHGVTAAFTHVNHNLSGKGDTSKIKQ